MRPWVVCFQVCVAQIAWSAPCTSWGRYREGLDEFTGLGNELLGQLGCAVGDSRSSTRAGYDKAVLCALLACLTGGSGETPMSAAV